MSTECIARLTLTGEEFDPDKLTSRVGITPTKTWRKGEQIGRNPSRRFSHNGWCLYLPKEKSLALHDQIWALLNHLSPYWSSIAIARKELGLDAEISCSINIRGTAPWIHFDREMLDTEESDDNS